MSGIAAISTFIPLAQTTNTSHLDNFTCFQLISHTCMFIPFNLFSNQPPLGSSWCLLLKMFIPRMLRLKSKIIPWLAKHSLIHDTFQCLLPLVIGFQHKSPCYPFTPPPKLHVTTLPTKGLCSCCSSAWKVISTDTHMVPSLILFRSLLKYHSARRAFFDYPVSTGPYSSFSISLSCFDFHHHLTLHYIF